MYIVKYQLEYKDAWDDFVDKSRNGTIFHTQTFLSYHDESKYSDSSILFMDKNNDIVGIFPAAIQKRGSEKILKSHPGSSYGGIVVGYNSGVSIIKDMLSLMKNFAIAEGFDAIELRTPESVFHKVPSEEIDYLLWQGGYETTSVELSSAIDLQRYSDSELIKQFKNDTFRSAQKAKRLGVSIQNSNDIRKYYDILSKNLMVRHGSTPTHTLEELILLKQLFPEKIRLYGAYYDGLLIAGTLLFCCNSNAYHTFYIAQDYDYQYIRALNLLFYELILFLKEEGIRYLNFGISTEYGGIAMNEGLFRFKEGFGAKGVVRRYYRKELSHDII